MLPKEIVDIILDYAYSHKIYLLKVKLHDGIRRNYWLKYVFRIFRQIRFDIMLEVT